MSISYLVKRISQARNARPATKDVPRLPRGTSHEPRKRFNENCFGQVESFLRARQRQDQSHADCNAALSFVAAPGLGHPALLRQGGYESGTDRAAAHFPRPDRRRARSEAQGASRFCRGGDKNHTAGNYWRYPQVAEVGG